MDSLVPNERKIVNNKQTDATYTYYSWLSFFLGSKCKICPKHPYKWKDTKKQHQKLIRGFKLEIK
jgi:hypothetical protein